MRSLLFAALFLPAVALAKPMHKLDDAELAELMLADKDTDERALAAEMLGQRKAESQVGALAKACAPKQPAKVCRRAMGALEAIATRPAQLSLHKIVIQREVEDALRLRALKILAEQDPGLVATAVPEVIRYYRTLDKDVVLYLIEHLDAPDQGKYHDVLVLLATDDQANQDARMAAFQLLVGTGHSNLEAVYMAALSWPDEATRGRSVQALGKTIGHTARVQPALVQAAAKDESGRVRSTAFKSLRTYASPALLPLLHNSVVHEDNSKAWSRAVDLLHILGDNSSVGPTRAALGNHLYMGESQVIALMQLLVRLGNPAAAETLEKIAEDGNNDKIKAEAKQMLGLLKGSASTRAKTVATWEQVEHRRVADGVLPAPLRTLNASMGDDGVVVWK